MRLLKTDQYQLVEAKDIPDPFPEYAILSHTWISPKDEITYQDFKTRKGDIENDVFKQKGWAKLKSYCDRAARDGWVWAWMDTCCIDKTSPADTQEAINAMFRWYQNAGICYVYLEDVNVHRILGDRDEDPGSMGVDDDDDDYDHLHPRPLDLDAIAGRGNVADPNSFSHKALSQFIIGAKWFTRGWTLQELLAPHYLVFVDRAWRRIGTRESWATEIMEASRIEARHLTTFNPTDFTSCSIAMRLSWASRRETTLEEDETYCLLGLFGISLPLIYGEGRLRAFNRLQRELITYYSDDSIFAWTLAEQRSGESFASSWPSQSQGHDNSGWGILAPSTREFWDASKVMAFGLYGSSFAMTNRGLEVNTKRWRCKNDPSLYHIQLSCGRQVGKRIVIYLHHVDDSYDRTRIDRLCDSEQIRYEEEWEEIPKEAILVRATSKRSSNTSTASCSSIFVLDYPEKRISIGKKYVVDFSVSRFRTVMKLVDDDEWPYLHKLKQNELFAASPDSVIFINIELQQEHRSRPRLKFDIVIFITESGFPVVGISPRHGPQVERLGDPLGESSEAYEDLASDIRYQVRLDPTYSVVAEEKIEGIAIGVHLLPRPRRLLEPPLGRNAKSIVLREYVLSVSVENISEGGGSEQQRRKRRRRA